MNQNDISARSFADQAGKAGKAALNAQGQAQRSSSLAADKATYAASSSQQMLQQLVQSKQLGAAAQSGVIATGQTAATMQAAAELVNATNFKIVADAIPVINSLFDSLSTLNTLYGDLTNIDAIASSVPAIVQMSGSVATVNTVYSSLSAFVALYGDKVNYDLLAASSAVINSVSTSVNAINAVAADLTTLQALSADKSNYDGVATNLSDFITVDSALTVINALAADMTALNALYSDKASIDALAADQSNINSINAALVSINAVAADLTALNALYTDKAKYDGVVADLTNINSVNTALTALSALAGDLTAFNAVYADKTKYDAVAADLANINTVISNLTNLNGVAGDKTNIDAVVSAISSINTCANNMAQLQTASIKAASAASLANVATQQASIAASAVSTSFSAYQTAQNQALLAQSFSLSAGSAIQQDLTAVTAQALHRSPNAVVALTIYDTSKDSDGGAWVDRMAATSWYNEPLVGSWLYGPYSGFASEMDARDWFGIGQSPTTGSLITGDSQTFTNGVGSWAPINANGTLAALSGRLRFTQTGALGTTQGATIALPTVAGQRYRIDLTLVTPAIGQNVFIGASTAAGGSGLGQVSAGSTYGSKTLSFVASGATTYVSVYGSNAWPTNSFAEIDNITCTPVSFAANPSGAYYQDATTGKHQRLWKNLLSYSDDATSGVTAFHTVVTTNAVAAPDGTMRADKIAGDTAATTQHWINKSFTAVAGQPTTFTMYAKAGELTKFTSFLSGGGGGFSVAWDLGAVTATPNGGMTATVAADPRGNGWYICTWTFTPTGSGAQVIYICQLIDGTGTYTGDGVRGLYIVDWQLEYSGSATAFESKAGIADNGQTETFRGNTAKFPRLSAIVAEASSITIYDLTQPGRPMWMRFTGQTSTFISCKTTLATVVGVSAVGGVLTFVNSNTGGGIVDFIKDKCIPLRGISDPTTLQKPSIAFRNTQGGTAFNFGVLGVDYFSLASGLMNAVAMTVLPDAPLDPFTLMQVPTIAVFTAGGISVIQNNGVVVNSASTSAYSNGTLSDKMLSAVNASSSGFAYALNPGQLGASFALSSFGGAAAASLGVFGQRQFLAGNRSDFTVRNANESAMYRLKMHEATPANSLVARIDTYSNTGYMVGDIRRCWLSDIMVGSITATELVTNGTFNTDLSGWTLYYPVTGSTTWDASGAMRLTPDATGLSGGYQDMTLVPGKTYRITGKTSAANVNLIVYPGTVFSGGTLAANDGANNLSLVFTAGAVTQRIMGYINTNGATGTIDNISLQEVISERSYKNKPLTINGTLTKALSGGLSMYSNWSAANYAQEAYSSDLDFGTAAWRLSAWINVPTNGYGPHNLALQSEDFTSVWFTTSASVSPNVTTSPTGTTTADKIVANTSAAYHGVLQQITAGTYMLSVYLKAAEYTFAQIAGGSTIRDYVTFDLINGVITQQGTGASNATITSVGNGWYRCATTLSVNSNGFFILACQNGTSGWSPTFAGNNSNGFYAWGAQINRGALQPYFPTTSTTYAGIAPILDRSAATGAYIRAGLDGNGYLAVEAYDGTTTRRATSTMVGNTAINLKAVFEYTLDGSLRVLVNGVQVGTTAGAPLLTLSNASAVTTIGNDRALDAAFPGSIALVTASATIASLEQEALAYQQELAMFMPNAICTLPDGGAIVDISYDNTQDVLKVLSAANESSWSGLISSAQAAVSSGSFTKAAVRSGVKLLARSTTSIGVDVTIPAYLLNSELSNRTQAANELDRLAQPFDFVGGFTCNTTNNVTSLTSVAGLSVPGSVNLRGMPVSGSGIPAGAFVTDISGATVYISAPATATASSVQVTFGALPLPTNYQAVSVYWAGSKRIEALASAANDWSRSWDGLVERTIPVSAWAYNAQVHITARKASSLN